MKNLKLILIEWDEFSESSLSTTQDQFSFVVK
jgi:hypothetical protein